jgi:hypothetical protein
MLFHPAIMALLTTDLLSLVLLVPAAAFAVQVLRHWNLASGSVRQIRLERATYLVATIVGFVLAAQLLALLLFVFTADALAVQFVGAMCAVGTLNVNGWGFPALVLKLALFFAAAAWLIVHNIDERARDYPFIRAKYGLLLFILPLALAAALVQFQYFLGLRADVITSCCGSLFSSQAQGVSGDMAALPPLPAQIGFYLVMALTLAAGAWSLLRRGSAWPFALLSSAGFFVAIAAVIAFVSPYIYEHPHHHCPFCLLKREYGYLGYLLYLPLFSAAALGFGMLTSLALAQTAGARSALAGVLPRMTAAAAALWLVFTLLVAWFSATSHLKLLG